MQINITPGGAPTPEPPPGGQVPYGTLGGEQVVRNIVERFYDHMDTDASFAGIRTLHPPDLARARLVLFEFLTGWLGGPPLYTDKYGHPRLRGRHMPFAIDVPERDQWLACMALSLDENKIEGEIRAFLDGRFAHVANFMRNQG